MHNLRQFHLSVWVKMEYKIILNIVCPDNDPNSWKCTKTITDKLEKKYDAKFHFKKENDIAHGGVVISHEPHKHIAKIVFYEKNEKIVSQHKKLSKIPSESEVKKIF